METQLLVRCLSANGCHCLQQNGRGRFKDLFISQHWRTTVPLCFIWFVIKDFSVLSQFHCLTRIWWIYISFLSYHCTSACPSADWHWLWTRPLSFCPRFANAFAYYGVVLLTTELFQASDSCGCKYFTIIRKGNSHGTLQAPKFKIRKPKTVPLAHLVAANAAKIEPICSLECKYLTSSDYKDLLWTTLAEFPGDTRPLGTFSYSPGLTDIANCNVFPLLGQHLFGSQHCRWHQHPDWTGFWCRFKWILGAFSCMTILDSW